MVYWLIMAILVFVAELFLGTVYLLVLSLSLFGAGLVAEWLGADVAMWVAGILSLVGCIAVYHYKQRHQSAPIAEDDLDKGQRVIVEEVLPTGEWRVWYRGALWEARIQGDGVLRKGDTAQIVGHDSNVLIIKSI